MGPLARRSALETGLPKASVRSNEGRVSPTWMVDSFGLYISIVLFIWEGKMIEE